eukprot:8087800-Lingulodinium_polyedra.AAC.1
MKRTSPRGSPALVPRLVLLGCHRPCVVNQAGRSLAATRSLRWPEPTKRSSAVGLRRKRQTLSREPAG